MSFYDFTTDPDNDTRVSSTRSHRIPLVVSVEGNIGCGKTTFLNYCQTKPNIAVYPEPIEKWQNVRGDNLLALFYENSRKWAQTFQAYVNMTMLDTYRKPTWKDIKVVERSLFSSRHCFMENMRRTGVLELTMYNVLDEWHERAWVEPNSEHNLI